MATRLTCSEFVDLVRGGLTADEAADERFILPKAYAAEVECAKDEDGAEKRTSSWVISTGTVDRMGDTIQVRGWKLTNFRKGGSILYGHNRSGLPIAKPVKVWKEGGESLNLSMAHATEAENPAAEHIYRLVKGGFLRSNSVGFHPLKWDLIDPDDWWGGINYMQQELVEDSIVPVPANPEALLQSVGKGLDVDIRLLTDWQRMAIDGEAPELGVYREDIAASLKALTGNPVSAPVPQQLELGVGGAVEKVGVRLVRPPAQAVAGADETGKADEGDSTVPPAKDVSPADDGDSPDLTDSYRERLAVLAEFEKLSAQTEQARAALEALGIDVDSTKSAGGAAGTAAAQPSAEDAPPADLAAQRSEDAAVDVGQVLDELAARAIAGDDEAAEQLRALGAKVHELAKSVEDEAPYFVFADGDGDGDEERADAPFFAFDNDDTDTEKSDTEEIAFDAETLAAVVRAAVQEELARAPGNTN
jgi:HK97 family phage prohead protease